MVRMLGMDPGIVNYGIAVTDLDKKTGRINVVKSAMLKNPVRQFTGDFRKDGQAFIHEISRWVKKYEPDGFIAERFQPRGPKTISVELVSLMLGMMSQRFRHLPHKYVIASTWKNDVNRRLALYDDNLKDMYKRVESTPHQLDAVLIGTYGLRVSTGVDFEYNWARLIRQVGERQ